MTWRGGLAANRSSRFQAPSQNSKALDFHNRLLPTFELATKVSRRCMEKHWQVIKDG
jgi:hypothetical protein